MRVESKFDAVDYYIKLTEAGLPSKQAKVMTDMLRDIEKIIFTQEENSK